MTTNQLTTATNLQAPNLSAGVNATTPGGTSNAQQYFNNFFAGNFDIGPANDALVAFFEKYTGSSTVGQQLAGTVLYTAQAQNIDPMALLTEFNQLSTGQLNAYLAAFLNYNRVPTSQLGIKTTTTTSPYITRAILP
jgi:hypothetical protein